MKGRDAALDGIRALAALGVWLLHVGAQTGLIYQEGMLARMTSRLGIAVPVFFLLSGLLLYRPWARAALEDDAPAPRAGRYLWHRVLRVMPAYWLVVVPVLLLWASLPWTGWVQWLLMLQNYTGGRPPDGLYQMWTMPIELAFYLLLPVLAWLLHRWARGGDRLVRLLAGIGVLPLVSVASVVVEHAFDLHLMSQWLPHYLIYFAAGMALAVLSVAGRGRAVAEGLAPHFLVLALLLYVVLSTELAGPRTLMLPSMPQALTRMALEAAIATLVVAPFALAPRRDSLRHRVLGNPVMAYMGRVSYSFFLWHVPLITLFYKLTGMETFSGDFLQVGAVTFVAAALVSMAAYHLVEEPVLRLRRPSPAAVPPPAPAPARPAAPVS
ncbi:acyltransferase family protein [Nonomuraea candida]|uniref:acyltransferase family protein n=1 Tax=Nonomuraea candida TaxID=359159 RepID=UPI0006939779|nr:acyltransferase [Nonomuraea candida]